MLCYPLQSLDWPFSLGHLLVPQLVLHAGLWQGASRGEATLCASTISCHSVTRRAQELNARLACQPHWKVGLPNRAWEPVQHRWWVAVQHASVSSITPTSTGSLAFHIPEPLCCASSTCAAHMLGDDNQGICIFVAMDCYQLLSHLRLKYNSLYFENSTQR